MSTKTTKYYNLNVNSPHATQSAALSQPADAWETDQNFYSLDDILHDIAESAGSSISVNGTPVASANLNSTSPEPPAGYVNVVWAYEGSAVSAYAPAGFLNPMLDAGDLIYEDPSLGAARLQIGTSGEVLTVVNGLPVWAATAQSKAGIYAADYGVKGNGYVAFGCSVSSGLSVVTNPAGGFVANAVLGQIVFGTNLSPDGFSTDTLVVLPQGTITQINSDTEITVSTTATTTESTTLCLVWGDDETTPLANAWAAAKAANTMLVLPGINCNGNGPAVILVQAASLCDSGAITGTGAMRTGVGACGGGVNATYLVPTPNFNPATAVQSACFCATPDGGNWHDFSIWGAGNSEVGSGFANLAGVLFFCNNNAVVHDIDLLAWGAAAANGLGVGYKVEGQIVIRNVDCDMFGQTGCQVISGESLGSTTFVQCAFWDNCLQNFYVSGTSTNPVYTFECNFGGDGTCNVSVSGGGVWRDFGSQIGIPQTGSGYGAVFIGWTKTVSGNTTGAGQAFLTGTVLQGPLISNTGLMLYLNNSSCSASLVGCTLQSENASTAVAYLIENNGVLYDGGGNQFIPTNISGTYYSGSTGQVYGDASITGTAQVSGNVALTNFGGSPSVGSVSGSTQVQQFTVTVGTSPSGTPQIVITFPTPFLLAPICYAIQVGGTNAVSTFNTGTVTTTSATFTYNGTLVAGDTLVIQVYAELP